MNMQPIVQVRQLGKQFKIYKKPWDRAREWALGGARAYHEAFWALRDVSFELQPGEALGLIGQNGAGKSTLLKILTGALYATEGEFTVRGRVLSMLELGTGFNNELTGRQNVQNSSHLLGFPASYVGARLQDIERFADIGDFFDRPIKLYSSGMRARLAFAMFAFLDCDVLIIDEVLSVGDTFFTQKCYERLEQLRRQNTAMIMVTHNMSVIQQYCQYGIVLDKGRVVFSGTPAEAATYYFFIEHAPSTPPSPAQAPAAYAPERPASASLLMRSGGKGPREWQPGTISWPHAHAFLDVGDTTTIGQEWARCTGVALCDDDGQPCGFFRAGQRAHWYYEFEALTDLYEVSGVLTLFNDKNIRVHGKHTMHLGVRPKQPLRRGDRVRIHQSVELDLTPGAYSFGIGLSAAEAQASNGMVPGGFLASNIVQAGSFQIIPPVGPHLGLCDLPGECEVELCSSISHRTLAPAIPG